jgi:hypothetical protein
VGKKLGEGSYAVVHEAKDLRDGAVYAMKIISKEKSKEKRLKSEVRGKPFRKRRKLQVKILVVALRDSDSLVREGGEMISGKSQTLAAVRVGGTSAGRVDNVQSLRKNLVHFKDVFFFVYSSLSPCMHACACMDVCMHRDDFICMYACDHVRGILSVCPTCSIHACKCLPCEFVLNRKAHPRFQFGCLQVALMKQVDHPNCVKLVSNAISTKATSGIFQKPGICLMMGVSSTSGTFPNPALASWPSTHCGGAKQPGTVSECIIYFDGQQPIAQVALSIFSCHSMMCWKTTRSCVSFSISVRFLPSLIK